MGSSSIVMNYTLLYTTTAGPSFCSDDASEPPTIFSREIKSAGPSSIPTQKDM